MANGDWTGDPEAWAALLAAPESHPLGPAAKRHRGSSHRTRTPAATVARLQPHLADLGITRVADVTGLDHVGLPVVSVCRPNARSVTVAMGKGLDQASARASGLMEAAEIAHAERIGAPLRLQPARELGATARLIDPLPPPPPGARPLDPDDDCLWIEGLDLIALAPVWVPLEAVHANFAPPPLPGSGAFRVSTNGLASGNHPLEALAHALFEVIERDCTARWYRLDRHARAATRLDLASVEDATARSVLDRLAAGGFEVAVWETTGPVGLASFYCLLVDPGAALAHPGEGAGCHPARQVALLRALLEAAQVRLAYVVGVRDDIEPFDYAGSNLEARRRRVRALMAGPPARRRFAEAPDRETATVFEDVADARARLLAAGVRTAALVDLTWPAIGIPVVRVVVPELLDEEDIDAPEAAPR